ncbi:MAG: phage portal protein [Ignavibacteria bacterium]|nr:phage portal protein [Ignavibacteria bacterium]
MKIFEPLRKLFSKDNSPSKSYNSGNWVSLLNNNHTDSSNLTNSWVYTGIQCRAENIATAKVYLYQKMKNGEVKEINNNHPFLDLINTTNIYDQSFYDIIYLLSLNLDVYGNAYLYVAPSKNNKPAQMVLLPTANVSLIYSQDKTSVTGYNYKSVGKNNIVYSTEEVIHFKLPSLANSFLGTPTIQSCKFAIDIDNFQQQYQKAFYSNNGSVGLALQTDQQLSEEAFNRMLDMWQSNYSGPTNANRVALLDNGLKIETFNNNPKEVDFINSRIELRDEILGKLRVSKAILGITTDVNRANAEAAKTIFIKYTIEPFSKFIQNGLNKLLRTYYGAEFSVQFEYPIEEENEIEFYKMLLDHGVVTVDEVRQEFGWEPLANTTSTTN